MPKLARLSLLIVFLGLFSFSLQAVPVKAETSLNYNNQLASLWETFSQINKLFNELKALIAKNTEISPQSQLAALGSSWFDSLSSNQWKLASPASRMLYQSAVDPSSTASPDKCGFTKTQTNPVTRTYSGLAVGGGKVFNFGGGHASHPGNDVDLYNVSANTWEVQYPPECPANGSTLAAAIAGAGGGVNAVTPLGRPYTQHSYRQCDYDSARDRFLCVLASGTWEYKVATKAWTRLVTPAAGSPEWTTGNGGVVYDPSADRLVAFVTGPMNTTQRGVYYLAPLSNTWNYKGAFPTTIAYVMPSATFNPDAQEILVLFPGYGFYRYKLSSGGGGSYSGTFTKVTTIPATVRDGSGGNFDYDTVNHRAVFLVPPAYSPSHPTQVFAWNPSLDAWETLPTPSTAPVGITYSDGELATFVYDNVNNVFIFLKQASLYCNLPLLGVSGGTWSCGGNTQTWAYRYAGGGGGDGGTDTIAPTVSLSAPASSATVSGSSVAVSANASDNIGVVGVQFKLDGVNLGAEDTTSPYGITWNTTSVSNGSHTLTAVARDAAGNTGISSGVSVTVNNTVGGGSGFTINLSLEEPGTGGSTNLAIPRTLDPITSGVPVPAEYFDSPWALTDGSTEIPVQISKLKGKNPWLLLDFQTDVAGFGSKNISLVQRTPVVSPSQPVVIAEDSLQATVTTGPLKAVIRKDSFNLFNGVWLDKNSDGVFTASEQVLSNAADAIRIVSSAGAAYSGKGVPTKIEWEYRGPMRSTLRVDGTYANGTTNYIGYTTRLTFYAGKSQIKIDYTIRNSRSTVRKNVKIKSAVLQLGGGAAAIRSSALGSSAYGAIDSTGATLELIPLYRHPMITTPTNDENEGLLIADSTHHGASFIADFAEGLSAEEKLRRARAFQSPLVARAAPLWYSERGELSTTNFGTLQDERDANTKWGWSWTSSQEPAITHRPNYVVNSLFVDTHGDSESDDAWQNMLMYLRTGKRGYYDRALAWARFFKWQYTYRTDGFFFENWAMNTLGTHPRCYPASDALTTTDTAVLDAFRDSRVDYCTYTGDHFWGWGMIDYYYLTGDVDAYEAALDLGEVSKRLWGNYNVGYVFIYGTRGPARHLMYNTRLYELTLDPAWKTAADHIADIFLGSSSWDSRGQYLWPQAYDLLAGGTVTLTKQLSPFHGSYVNQAFYRYYRLTGNTSIRDRLIKMADFAVNYALEPTRQLTAQWMALDYPTPDAFFHIGLSEGQFTTRPYHTATWIDTLVRAYRLTGNAVYLNKAVYLWSRASKLNADGGVIADATHVGYFMNSRLGTCCNIPDSIYYEMNGFAPFSHLLFYDVVRSSYSSDTAPPTVSLTTPASGATVSGSSVAVSANASDNIGVVGVQFKLDGVNLGAEDTTSPYGITWNTTGVSNGTHTLTVVARDAAGNTGVSGSVSVTVSNSGVVTPTLTLSASPTSIISGSPSTLTWSSTNVTSCTASGAWSGTKATSGTQVVSPTGTSIYTLVCTGAGGTVTQSTTVTVSSSSFLPSAKFNINDRVKTTASLNVRSTPSTSGTLMGNQATGALGTVIGGPTYAAGYHWWQINYDNAPDGWSIEDFLNKVSSAPTLTLSASLTSVTPGSSSTLTWSSANAVSCSASGTWSGSKTTSGTHIINPIVTSAYTLTCTGSGGSITKSVTITVSATADTITPTTPAGFTAVAISSSEINLSWTASTDNIAVAGYKIFRGGTQITTVSGTTYADTGLSPSTLYGYTVAAYDAAGNVSGQSLASSATTQAGTVTTTPTPILTPTPSSGGSYVAIPPASPVTPQTLFTFSTGLSIGSTHTEVKILQHFLNIQGFPVSVSGLGSLWNETDYFGIKTSEALKKYQCRYNVICSGSPATTGWGILGPKTIARINGYLVGYNVKLSLDSVAPSPSSPTAPVLSASDRETLIKQLQDQIKELQAKLLQLQLQLQ